MKFTNRYSVDHDISNLSEPKEWPLRLVIFGEFQPEEDSGHSPSHEAKAYPVDKESFDEILSKAVGNLPLKIQDSNIYPLEKQLIRLPVRNMRSFHPATIAEVVPELRKLLILRRRVTELANGELSFEEFQSQANSLREGVRILERLSAAEPASMRKPKSGKAGHKRSPSGKKLVPAQADDLVDSILGIVDLPDSESGQAATVEAPDIENLISEIGETRSTGVTRNSDKIREILIELDKILSSAVERILHHPEFRRLESLWRGLKFLVDRTDFREPISIEIRVCAKEDLPDIFAIYANQVESRGGFDSDTVVLAACEFDRSSKDIKILRQLSEIAESLQVPLISSVGLNFFGLESIVDFERLSSLKGILDQTVYAKFHSLREAESSRWLTLLFNRFLLRYLYGPDQIRVKAFNYTETLAASPSAAYLWGNPVWGIGSLLTRQFAAAGNCLSLTGWERGLIQDLSIREVQLAGGETAQYSLELNISEGLLADLTKAGITVPVSRMNTDSAAILSIPTVHLPERYSDEEETRQTRLRALLPYQLFVSRMAICARRLAGAISPGLAPDTVTALIKEIVTEFIPGRNDAEAVEVEVRDSERYSEYYDVTLTLRPERAGWRLPPIQMQLRVNR